MTEHRRLWRGVDPDLFRFTTTDLRDLHVALMGAFEDAAVLAPALNFDQVRVALAASGWDEPTADDVLTRALAALCGWGLLEATQDRAAHYATPEEFERKNLQWSLTARGEAAVTGLLHALDALRQVVGLQPAVLDAIGDGLSDLGGLLASPPGAESDARIHIRLAEVEGHLASLVASVRQFNAHLQRLVREDPTDDGTFVEVKRRTVAYLEEYVDGVERKQRRVAAALAALLADGVARLYDRALAGANLAPVIGGDAGPRWLAERARRWAALQAWFAPADGSTPRIAGLLDIARTAIVELLRVLERRWDSRRRSASIANDFRCLAEWFAAAPGDAEAQRLFAAAFGLWPARHAHLVAVDGEARAPTVSWSAAEAVEVAPALRTTGTLANRGRVRPVADPAWLRAERQRAQAESLAAYDALRAGLGTAGVVRLSSFGILPADVFAELLALLAAGLDTPAGTDGARRALSADGWVEVVLHDAGDGRRAIIGTPGGTLSGPDLWVSITVVGAAADDAASPRPTVGERTLATHLDEERARAARVLLATPLLDAGADPDDFRLVVRHQGWLVNWFESTCGWTLSVDAAGGFARLMKRSAHPDPTRPLRRARGSETPFDRRRYQLLCLACAVLVRHPVTTIGLLAGAVADDAGLDTTLKTERVAFVDALRALMAWGALTATAGDVDAFADSEAGNAILTADTARLHRLLSSATTPSSVAEGTTAEGAAEMLLTEPRYGDAAADDGTAESDQRLRWVRH
ncbi:MAG: TIGR02677 family protein, partial [Acidimicrobiia bacterium]